MLKRLFAKLHPAAQGALCSTVTLVTAMYLLAAILHLSLPYVADTTNVFSAAFGLLQRAPATLVAGCMVCAGAQCVFCKQK